MYMVPKEWHLGDLPLLDIETDISSAVTAFEVTYMITWVSQGLPCIQRVSHIRQHLLKIVINLRTRGVQGGCSEG